MKKLLLIAVIFCVCGMNMLKAQLTQASIIRTNGNVITVYIKPAVTIPLGADLLVNFSLSLPGSTGPATLTATSSIGGNAPNTSVENHSGRRIYNFVLISGSTTVEISDAGTAIATVAFPSSEDGDVVQLNDYTGASSGSNPETLSFYYVSRNGTDITNYNIMFYGTNPVNAYPGDSQVEANLPLPVTLISFDAEKLNNRHSLLSWSTASEINSSFFSVQRSLDKKVWTSIGKVDAQGNSQIIRNYEFVDENVYNGLDSRLSVYYRLEMVDLDGQRKMSPVKNVVFGSATFGTRDVSVYPNPSSEGVQLEWDASRVDQPTSIEFFNSKGELVYTSKVSENTNQQYIDFDQTSIIPGLYILRILSGPEAIEHKQIIVTQR